MRKVLVVDPKKCTGCRYCEVICAFSRKKECGYSDAAIYVIRDDRNGDYRPLVCRQCEFPPCAKDCPTGAIGRDSRDFLQVDQEKCIGCYSCVTSCPWGIPRFDGDSTVPILCDLCQGDPVCVKCCGTGAIEFLSFDEVHLFKRRNPTS